MKKRHGVVNTVDYSASFFRCSVINFAVCSVEGLRKIRRQSFSRASVHVGRSQYHARTARQYDTCNRCRWLIVERRSLSVSVGQVTLQPGEEHRRVDCHLCRRRKTQSKPSGRSSRVTKQTLVAVAYLYCRTYLQGHSL